MTQDHVEEYKVTGVISVGKLRELGLIPPVERLRKGPVAVAECPERIPCNICSDVCPFGAISMKTINDIPRIDWNRCAGCGICVAKCPGLAIFIVDLSKPGKALITIPYEFLPRPRRGELVTLLGRDGRRLGKGKVVRVLDCEKTLLVTVEAPEDQAMEVRAIWVERREDTQ